MSESHRFLRVAVAVALLVVPAFITSPVSSYADDHPRPTPNPYRNLPLTIATLNQSAPVGSIQVLSGFGAARRDGTSALACISFQNIGTITATRIVVSFPLMDHQGNTVATLRLDRRGTFSPGVGIMSYANFAAWADGNSISNKTYLDNCASVNPGVSALPLLSARYATYKITRVEYANGTVWPKTSH